MISAESVSSCRYEPYTDSLIMRTIAPHGDLFAPSVRLVARNLLTMSSVNDLAFDDSVQSYNERAFRYLLSIEQKRLDRSGNPFALMLVDLRDVLGVGVQTPQEVTAGVFAALTLGLRETDFAGWYRENEVAGAVLTPCGSNTADQVRGRLTDLLNEHVSGTAVRRLQIRIVEFPAQTHAVTGNRSEPCQ